MAKILFSLYQVEIGNIFSNLACYYESFIKELQKYDNSVLVVNRIRYHHQNPSNYEEQLTKEVTTFKPDLIITFNNQIDECVLKSTDCPVLLFDADTVQFFQNKHFIKKYSERYFMISSWFEMLSDDYSSLDFLPNRIHSIHLATSVKSEKKEKLHNISFIGSKFGCFYQEFITPNFSENMIDTLQIYEALKYHWINKDFDYDKILKRFCTGLNFKEDQIYSIFDSRNYILSSLLDLDLKLYGVNWHDNLDNSNLALATAYDKTPKFSLQHNQDIYNSSKISISISHPQAKGNGFPYRIYDIMASDSLLITAKSTMLEKLTKGHVVIPSFDSPFDARDLCKKFLKEENWRKDIIAASNEYIEKFGRWDDNIKKLEEISEVLLCNTKDTNCINHTCNFFSISNFDTEHTNKKRIEIQNNTTLRAINKFKRIFNLLKELTNEIFFVLKVKNVIKKIIQ